MTMPKQKKTPEEKALARSLKIQAETDARLKREFEEKAALEKYRADLPRRLMNAQALAGKLGVSTEVTLTETGPSVEFRYEDSKNKIYIDDSYTYESNEWEVENLEDNLNRIKAEKDEADRRMQVAQAAYNKLTDEEKKCLKENIVWCR